ncbi:hypothetical protein D3C86_1876940 [compost metagenome]
MMPEAMRVPPGAVTAYRASASSTMTSARMLAKTSSAWLSRSPALPTRLTSRSLTPLMTPFSSLAATATGSVSTATASGAPSRRAAIARIPEPAPTS